MSYDDFSDEDDDDDKLFMITDFEKFVTEVYTFAMANLDAVLDPRVANAPDEKREEIKTEILSEMPTDYSIDERFEQMVDIYPLKRVVEEVKKVMFDDESGNVCITTVDLQKIVETVSKEMLFSILKQMEKEFTFLQNITKSNHNVILYF